MTHEEFVSKVVGLPWVSHSATWESLDCYGLVVMYYRHVLGIELDTEDFDSGIEIDAGYNLQKSQWKKTDKTQSVVFMSFVKVSGERVASHCGIRHGAWCLHSAGGKDTDGHVRHTRLSAMKKLYPDMEFYEYVG